MAEYAYNSLKHRATKLSPFYANFGFEPWTTWPIKAKIKTPSSIMFGYYMNTVHNTRMERLLKSISDMHKFYDTTRKSIEPFMVGAFVMLHGRNIHAQHRCKKLQDMLVSPCTVQSVGKNLRYCKLELLQSCKIHLVFIMSLLERYRREEPKKQVIEIEMDEHDRTIESIIASGLSDDNAKKHVFLGI
jgi:hypothetical protein